MFAIKIYVLLLLLAIILAVNWAVRKRGYVFAIFIGLAFLYELSGLMIRVWSEELAFLIPATRMFTYGAGITQGILAIHCAHLAIFLIISVVTYHFFCPFFNGSVAERETKRKIISYWPILIGLLVFGLISVATGAGNARRLDYEIGSEGYGAAVTGVHSVIFYGRLLFVAAAPLLLRAYQIRRWMLLGFLLIAILPMAEQLFIAGRRQAFVPFVLYLLLFVFYVPQVKHKAVIIGAMSFLFAAAAGVMFSTRADYYQEAYGLAGSTQVYRPFFQELMSVSTISLSAESEMEAGTISFTYGLHWIQAFLDSAIPFFKLGSYLQDSFNLFGPEPDLSQIAPYGALSMLADGFIAFGYAGSAVLALASGTFFSWINPRLSRAFSRQPDLSYYDVWITCLAATVLVNYRSGLGDAVALGVKFSIIYWLPLKFLTVFRLAKR